METKEDYSNGALCQLTLIAMDLKYSLVWITYNCLVEVSKVIN